MTGEYAVGVSARKTNADPLVGRVLSDRYRVLRKLGEGGAGGVYLAEHIELGRTVALKILLPEFMRGQQAIDDFLNEARMVARLGHENIIDISYGGQSPDGLVFLAMEYLDGRDLGQVLRRDGPLPWDRARRILLQVASALEAVHREGIVHSDIKPENIFVTQRDGQDFVKVLDFGVAKALGATDRNPRSISGTPQYMSPEQTLGNTLDARSDVYSLGCVMYQMLTGTLPFQADSVLDLMAKHNYESPEPLRQRRPDLGIMPAVERIVLKAMEKDPAARFPSMAALSEAIARVRLNSALDMTPAPQPTLRIDDPRLRSAQRWRRLRVWSVFAAGVIAISAVGLHMARERVPARVAVTVRPSGAAVFVDGRKQGQTPLAAPLGLPPGRHFVWAEAPGYLRQQQELQLEEGQHYQVSLALPLSPATGIEITSEPPGLPVWLDGKPLLAGESEQQAHTGTIARRLTAGKHAVEVRDGQRVWRQDVVVEPDKIVHVHAAWDDAAGDRNRTERPRRARPDQRRR